MLQLALNSADDYLGSLNAAPVCSTRTIDELRQRLSKPLSDGGLDPKRVITELIEDAHDGLLRFQSGRFFAWVVGGSVPSALAADWLTSAWDQNATIAASSPAAAVVEEIVGAWLKDLLRIPESASFALVTGCQMAHVTALAAARHSLLARIPWDVELSGLSGAPQLHIIASRTVHGSIHRAAQFLGLGTRNLILLEPDNGGMLRADDVARTLDQLPAGTAIVVLQAGEINTGVFDPFAKIIPVAREHGAWVHVDGAFGLWANCSRQYRHFLEGAEDADSWATDGHKWLNVPFDCGYAFVRDSVSHRAAMSFRAPYLAAAADARDPFDWNPEWSRRARGFATYAALRELGRDGIEEIVDRCSECARTLVLRIGALPGARVVWEPSLNQGLVRFFDDDAETERVITAINATGEAFFSGTEFRGMRAMRVSVCNWRTTRQDIDRAVAAVRRALARETSLT